MNKPTVQSPSQRYTSASKQLQQSNTVKRQSVVPTVSLKLTGNSSFYRLASLSAKSTASSKSLALAPEVSY